MTQAHKTPGNLVRVKDKCFDPQGYYYPYYNDYVNHTFEVVSIEPRGHISLKCVSGLLDKDGKPLVICIHDDEIQSIPKNSFFWHNEYERAG